MTRPVAVISILLATALGNRAYADGVINGAQLLWNGNLGNGNLNQIYIEAGEIKTNSLSFNTGGLQLVTAGIGQNAAFALDVPQLKQAASAVYYVYGALTAANTIQWVISLTQPNTASNPSQAISWNVGGPTSHAVFVGSYITDSNATIVPFLKEGDEVVLTPLAQNRGVNGNMHQPYWLNSSENCNGAWPQVDTFNWGGGIAAAPPIPLSASAVLYTLILQGVDVNGPHQVQILNPTLKTDTTVGTSLCTTASQLSLHVGQAGNGGGTPFDVVNHARIKTAINPTIPAGSPGVPANPLGTSLSLGFCQAACTPQNGFPTYSLWGYYVGYVETNHHLSF